MRTAPGDLRRMRATALVSRPAMMRRATTSAWSLDSPATRVTACLVDSPYSTSSSTGFPDVGCCGMASPTSTLSRNRLRDRAASMARCLPMREQPGAELVRPRPF